MSESIWNIKSCNIFANLPSEELRQLESRSLFRQLPRDSTIYLPFEEANGVILVISGRVRIFHATLGGKQSIVAFIEPGELFGESSILKGGTRDEFAEAVASSALLVIPAEDVQRLMEQHVDIAIGIARLIGLRRKRIERRLKYLVFHSIRVRLINVLLELAEQYGEPSDEGVELVIKLTHETLASIAGCSRESVTTVLGELQLEGLVRTGCRKIKLIDIGRMAEVIDVPAPVIADRLADNSRLQSGTAA